MEIRTCDISLFTHIFYLCWRGIVKAGGEEYETERSHFYGFRNSE